MSDDTSKDETVTTSTIGETEMKQFFSAFLAVMILAGCANTMPLIDMKSSGNPPRLKRTGFTVNASPI